MRHRIHRRGGDPRSPLAWDCLEPRVLLAATPPDHVVVVIEENHSYGEIIGNATAPYINSLARQGLSFTDAHGLFHPSQPNYLALFAGSNYGVFDNNGPYDFVNVPNLGSQLIAAGKTFIGYAEDLPEVGSTVITSGHYDRRHNPWVDFDNVPPTSNRPFTDFPSDFTTLPTVSFIVPNETHNSHDAPVADADAWLQSQLGAYAQWAKTHNSLLIVTWDEAFDDANHIPMIVYGANVTPGQYVPNVTHYNVLRTIEDLYGLTPLAGAATAAPIDYTNSISTPDLTAASDDGVDNTDDVTSIATPTFTGTAAPGTTVKIFGDGVEIGTGVATNGVYSITVSALTSGAHLITAGALDAQANLVLLSPPLTVTIDRAGPRVTQVQFNDQPSSANVRRISMTFDGQVNVALPHLVLRNDSTGKTVSPAKMVMTYNGATTQAVWTFPGLRYGLLENGNYTATLLPAVTDLVGNPLDGDGNGVGGDAKTFTFFQLAADANGDRVVDHSDIKMFYSRQGAAPPGEPADFNGDGQVGFVDFQILELNFGLAIPAPLPTALPAQPVGVLAVTRAPAKKLVAVQPPIFARKPILKGRAVLKDLLA